jgi:hypothetical protein
VVTVILDGLHASRDEDFCLVRADAPQIGKPLPWQPSSAALSPLGVS